jgi:hypothetical protein
MKIVSINTDPTATNERQISFNTDPPLTREVFDMYSLIVGRGNMFTLQNGLLTTKIVNIDPTYLTQASESLSEAERQIENAKKKSAQARLEFLKRISTSTGIPLAAEYIAVIEPIAPSED